jgi:glycosyltransferase involved in cell wall biosynthesis
MNTVMTKRRMSVVVPAHNEATNIAAMHAAVSAAVANIDVDLELIFVDDGSGDATAQCVVDLSAADSRVRLIPLARNFGHQAALLAGLHAATGDAVITMDCDLQHPPSLIPDMVAAWRAGHRVVQMVREDTLDASPTKRIMSRNFYRLMNLLSDTPITPGAADFQLLDRAALEALLRLGDQRPFLRGMVSWLGFSTASLRYVAAVRASGSSTYTWRRMATLAVDAITAFSVKPLRIAFYIGCVSATMSVLYLGYIFGELMAGRVVEGWTSLMVVLLFLGAAQLVTLGIIGEYVGRIYDQTRGRPRYLIRPPDETGDLSAPSQVTGLPGCHAKQDGSLAHACSTP